MSAPDAAPPPDVELNPRAIRDALLPEEVGDFDRQYRQAMLAATESLDLADVLALLEHRRWLALTHGHSWGCGQVSNPTGWSPIDPA